MNLLLFGAPGTGKGTQASFLVSHYSLYHISTGDLFRKAKGTDLGKKAKSYMDNGDLVPDSIVIALIKQELSKLFSLSVSNDDKLQKISQGNNIQSSQGFILDGFPRTLVQAEALDEMLNDLNLVLDKVLYVTVPEKILLERIVGRRVAEKSGHVYHIKFKPPMKPGVCDKTQEKLIHRSDDKEDVVKKRLENYYKQTAPLIQYYHSRRILFEIDGCGASKEVFSRISAHIVMKEDQIKKKH